MPTYNAPIADIRFALEEMAGLGALQALPGLEDAGPELVGAVLEEAGKFANSVLAPLNRAGDRQGARLENGAVVTTPGWQEAYRAFVEGGWNGVAFDPEWGGQGLPWLVNAAVQEMWQAANLSFALCPLLTQGAVEAILFHGSEAQKRLYLPKLVTGEWTGTMCLTEPQAGSDLAAVRTRAVREGDHYRISGQKIFITYGEHDLTPNIVHLVLARMPDAPEGVKGISLFIVPKFLPDAAGEPGDAQRRALRLARAQARHPCQPHRRARLRRYGGRDRLPRRRGEPRPRVHVHHDEHGPAVGRAAGAGHRRARLPAGPCLRPRAPAGPGAGRTAQARGRPSSGTRMCAGC